MKYQDLLDAHLKYGTTSEDIKNYKQFDKILENVIIAPWWKHDIFDGLGFKCEQVGERVYNFYGDDISFSYIELKLIGAPSSMDAVMPLGVTDCKNIIFLGSVGSLSDDIKPGDIVVPKYSICGDGASRYLNKNLEDEFLKREYPSKEYTNQLLKILDEEKIKYHYVPNFSIDTIFAQFFHVDKIIELGCKTIEMETANLFKCNELLKLNVTALFCVSDNTITKKSLYSGRTDKDRTLCHKIREEVIPQIVIKLFKKNNTW